MRVTRGVWSLVAEPVWAARGAGVSRARATLQRSVVPAVCRGLADFRSCGQCGWETTSDPVLLVSLGEVLVGGLFDE